MAPPGTQALDQQAFGSPWPTAVESEVFVAVYHSQGAQVSAGGVAERLATEIAQRGGTGRLGERVTEVLGAAGRTTGIRLDGGETVAADP